MKSLGEIRKIDLHMHSTVSDGTDTPEEILVKVKEAGIDMFSLTDHDDFKGCLRIQKCIAPEDPLFITGVEFSCRDQGGKYHILGYGYDPDAKPVRALVSSGHKIRLEKLDIRLKALKERFGFIFSGEDIKSLYALDNPGKPHIANLMVKYRYVRDKQQAFAKYLNQVKTENISYKPEDAVSAILQSGGIPVLAHPSFGSGDELFMGEEMGNRLLHLLDFGIQGLEAYYSGFSPKLQDEILELAEKYDLYVTAGSDYHGNNKMVKLGDNRLASIDQGPEGLQRFLRDVKPAGK